MKIEITSKPVAPPPPPPPDDVQIVLDRDSAERLRALVGRVGGSHDFATEVYGGLGEVLYGNKYSTQGKYAVNTPSAIIIEERK